MTSTAAVRTPLPTFQLFVVYLVQLAEPITATVIYPFAPEFVRRTGITGGDETKTGYYAGLIESAFFIAECLSVFHWGRAADVFGRRRVLLLGPLGLALSMVGFGLSKNFWFLVLFRCLQGIFNGNIGLTDSTNIGDAFAFLPLVWSIGSTTGYPDLGRFVGGSRRQMAYIQSAAVIQDHPYPLPCGVAGSFAFVIFILTLISLKETHPSITKLKKDSASAPLLDNASDPNYGTTGGTEAAETPVAHMRTPSFREITNKNVLNVVITYCFLSFNSTSFEVLMPLMYSTSISIGGLGLNPYQIGWIIMLIRTLGARRAFITSCFFLLAAFAAFSFESYFAKKAGYIDWRVITLMGLHMAFNLMIFTAYGAVHVLIVQSATSRETLGSTNGFAQMANSGTRGFAPSVASSLFSLTLQKNLAGGFGVYIVYLILISVGLRLSFGLPRFSKR
ncbi:major facilitator superfamily domain-containing protein [Mucidula mucida]|nr:major facilitator superfamily domain-containing protein [Mucidula mucida]